MKKETKKLIMQFSDVEGHMARVVVPNPKEEITATGVAEVGEKIVKQQVLESTHGLLAAYKGATLMETKVEALA